MQHSEPGALAGESSFLGSTSSYPNYQYWFKSAPLSDLRWWALRHLWSVKLPTGSCVGYFIVPEGVRVQRGLRGDMFSYALLSKHGSLILLLLVGAGHLVLTLFQDYEKKGRLKSLLQQIMDGSKILIFAETKKGADTLTRDLRIDGWPALCIHGDKKQEERQWVLNEFKGSRSPIMVATDVASRGLDVKDVRYVVNYDFPNQIEDYVHRIGRTGRAGTNGSAYTFFTTDKFRMAGDLVKVLREAQQQVPSELEKLIGSRGGDDGGRGRFGGGGRFGGRGGGGGGGGSRFGGGDRYGSGGSRWE
eukprot:GHVN01063729.1.p1 GENE.GHVN01063729.1~~GHVN01063729.1.p1  ORF type:complete len:304 (-),score=31.27 GHVN01063729.1:272-1183(-)